MTDEAPFSEQTIIYEATKDAIVRARRALLVISTLIGLGFFHLFLWYGSWELARMDARKGVAEAIRQKDLKKEPYTGDMQKDKDIAETMEKEASDLEHQITNKEFDVPLVGAKVSRADFSVAILMVAGAVLLWLLFFQRRLNACLRCLDKLVGWQSVAHLLQYHFTLIGSHSTSWMKAVARGLLFGLPFLAFCFLLSDSYDFYRISNTPIRLLAFTSKVYWARVCIRLGVDVSLFALIGILSYQCYQEFRTAEDDLLRYVSGPPPDEQ